MAGDYATREELDRRAEAILRDLRDTERLLRDRDDEKERILRAEFIQAVQASEDRMHDRLDGIDQHLTEQDRWLMRRRFVWRTWRRDLLGATIAALAALFIYYGFHIQLP